MDELRGLDPGDVEGTEEDLLDAWGDDEGPDGPRRWDLAPDRTPDRRSGRRSLLLVAAVAPWLVVAAIVLRPGPGPTPAPTLAGVTETPGAYLPPPGSDIDDGSGDSDLTAAPDALVFGARVAPGAADATAVAVAAARSWLGDAGPPLELGLDSAGVGGYLEHVAVESVDLPLPDLAVVSLLAIVLDADGEEWSGARVIRLAVPVRLSPDAARPAGSPWLLPSPDLSLDEPAWTAVEETEELVAAGGALAAAGYRDVNIHRLERSESWPLRATITAIAPGAAEPSEHLVWLRRHLGDYVVAGLLPSAHRVEPGEQQ